MSTTRRFESVYIFRRLYFHRYLVHGTGTILTRQESTRNKREGKLAAEMDLQRIAIETIVITTIVWLPCSTTKKKWRTVDVHSRRRRCVCEQTESEHDSLFNLHIYVCHAQVVTGMNQITWCRTWNNDNRIK